MPRIASAIALAACAFELSAPGDDNLVELQVLPAGRFHPSDGRKLEVPGWHIASASAQRVIDRFNARKTPAVIDYEHQTLRKETNGQPAPAAAWFKSLQWREGDGLYATVELTAKAREQVAAGEYRYFSPVFRYNKRSGEVEALEMGALTNTPAIDGMEALTVRATACLGADNFEDDTMNELLKALFARLGLADDASEQDAIAALNQHFESDPLAPVRSALGANDNAGVETLVAACTQLKEQVPDPSKFVPVSTVQAMQGEIASLNQRLADRESKDADSLIASALEDGRLLKPMEDWARELAKTDIAALNKYLDAAQPIAALASSQTGGEAPVDDDTGLTQDELAVCNNMGLTPEAFKKAKTA